MDKEVSFMIHQSPDRSARWQCGQCGGICYYPQATRGDRALRMPYRYCPHCGCEIWKVVREGKNLDKLFGDALTLLKAHDRGEE